MRVTLRKLAGVLESVLADNPAYRIQLVTRRAGSSTDVELRKLGNFLLLGDEKRVVLVRAELCDEPLSEVPLLSPFDLLSKLNAHIESHGECELEILNDAFVSSDGTRVLDYGGRSVDQLVRHTQREEVWLLVACATIFDSSSGPLVPL